jgi:DNA-binding MarR family transcriptional regulator
VKTIHLLSKASGVIREIDRTMTATRKEVLAGISRAELQACLKTLQRVHDSAAAAARIE